MTTGCITIVSDRDRLSDSLQHRLRSVGADVQQIRTGVLSASRLSFEGDTVIINGRATAAVVYRAEAEQSASETFVVHDRQFCDQETKATWLALHHLPSVWTLNRVDAEIWYALSEWSVWHERFRQAGLPVAEFDIGATDYTSGIWIPWGSGTDAPACGLRARRAFLPAHVDATSTQEFVVVAGRPLDQHAPRSIHSAAEWLATAGVNLAKVFIASNGALIGATERPSLNADDADQAATVIMELVDAVVLRR